MNLEQVQQLLQTEMDRKEFLAYLGATLLAVVGISSLLKALAPPAAQDKPQSTSKTGYGGSPYGR